MIFLSRLRMCGSGHPLLVSVEWQAMRRFQCSWFRIIRAVIPKKARRVGCPTAPRLRKLQVGLRLESQLQPKLNGARIERRGNVPEIRVRQVGVDAAIVVTLILGVVPHVEKLRAELQVAAAGLAE